MCAGWTSAGSSSGSGPPTSSPTSPRPGSGPTTPPTGPGCTARCDAERDGPSRLGDALDSGQVGEEPRRLDPLHHAVVAAVLAPGEDDAAAADGASRPGRDRSGPVGAYWARC